MKKELEDLIIQDREIRISRGESTIVFSMKHPYPRGTRNNRIKYLDIGENDISETIGRPSILNNEKWMEIAYKEKCLKSQRLIEDFIVLIGFFVLVSVTANYLGDLIAALMVAICLFLKFAFNGLNKPFIDKKIMNFLAKTPLGISLIKRNNRRIQKELYQIKPNLLGFLIDEFYNYNSIVQKLIEVAGDTDNTTQTAAWVELGKVIEALTIVKTEIKNAILLEREVNHTKAVINARKPSAESIKVREEQLHRLTILPKSAPVAKQPSIEESPYLELEEIWTDLNEFQALEAEVGNYSQFAAEGREILVRMQTEMKKYFAEINLKIYRKKPPYKFGDELKEVGKWLKSKKKKY